MFGLIDIAQEKNHQFIRHPIAAGNPNNIPAGTIYNKPDPNNARFYTDQGLGGLDADRPGTGQRTFTRYNFNTRHPLAGDPVLENATGLLMRNMQWMIQTIGVDGFRVDAARHMPDLGAQLLSTTPCFAPACARTSTARSSRFTCFRKLPTATRATCRRYIRTTCRTSSASAQRHHGARQSRRARFPAVLRDGRQPAGNGSQNNWHNIRGASMDTNDNGLGAEVWATTAARA